LHDWDVDLGFHGACCPNPDPSPSMEATALVTMACPAPPTLARALAAP
jgi:hypothetical protein